MNPNHIRNIHIRTILAVGLAAGLVAGSLAAPCLAAGASAAEATAPAANPVQPAPVQAAPVQAAPVTPRPGYVVFFEQGRADVSPAAADTIRLAANAARASKAHIIRIVGRTDHAQAVKAALESQGVPAQAIVLVGPEEGNPIVRASTGVAEPINRRVLIAF